MRTLVIDCSTEACSVALFDGDTALAHDHRLLGRGHAEQLIPMIAALPGRGEADRILVALGPGSFTGIRIGIASARALALVWGAQVLGYPTLALVAAVARQQAGAYRVDAVMAGGHGEWFFQPYAGDGLPLAAASSLVPAEAARAARAEIVAGTQAAALVERRGHGQALTLHPCAQHIFAVPPSLFSARVQPIYGRAPDARPAAAPAP